MLRTAVTRSINRAVRASPDIDVHVVAHDDAVGVQRRKAGIEELTQKLGEQVGAEVGAAEDARVGVAPEGDGADLNVALEAHDRCTGDERCAASGIEGVYVEGGSQVLSELLHNRELDYLFVYRAPILFGDDRARPIFRGLRTEKLDQAVRLERVRHATAGDDQLMRGFVAYPGKLSVEGTRLEMDVSVGDRVLYGKYSGTDITLDGEEYLILRESDVLAIVK